MDKVTFYTTIENQVRNDGSKGLLYDHFDEYESSLAKYYTVLSAAAVSEIPYHSGYIIRDDGVMTDGRKFDRRDDNRETYTTLENQIRADGSKGLLYDHFNDRDEALAKYYTILAAASISEIPYHAGFLIRDDVGDIEKKEVFDRRTVPVEEELEV